MVLEQRNQYAAFIGIDWADQKHDYCINMVGCQSQDQGQIDSHPEAVHAFVTLLRHRFGGQKVALCLEQTKGALIYQLMGADFIDLYPINPQALANYRRAFSVSRAKNDPKDAWLLADYLVKHFEHLRRWQPDDVDTRKLAMLVEDRRKMVDLRTRLSNQLTAKLKTYFPQALSWVGASVTSPMACDFLMRWPSLDLLKRAHSQTIRTFYTQHHVRNRKTIDARLVAIRNSIPLVEDAAIVDTAILRVKALCRQIACLNDDIDEYDRQIAALFESHPDAELFDSLPGAGAALAPRLLVAFGTDRNRFDSALEVATFSGIAPVTETSGNHEWVHWRLACPKFLRQSFHEFANLSRQHSDWAGAFYQIQRSRGKSHHAAIRSLAFKWIRILFHCWKHEEPYDEHTYLMALKRAGSPILDFLSLAA